MNEDEDEDEDEEADCARSSVRKGACAKTVRWSRVEGLSSHKAVIAVSGDFVPRACSWKHADLLRMALREGVRKKVVVAVEEKRTRRRSRPRLMEATANRLARTKEGGGGCWPIIGL